MIIICPTCLRRYEVDQKAIGDSRMVRCVICGTTWQQDAVNSVSKKTKKTVFNQVFIWALSVLCWGVVGSYIYVATPCVDNFPKYWNYLFKSNNNECRFLVKNISHAFVKKDDGYYVKVLGEIENLSIIPSDKLNLVFNLRTYPDKNIESEVADDNVYFNETWVEKIKSENIKNGRIITFSSFLKKIPVHDVLCTIKLDNKFNIY